MAFTEYYEFRTRLVDAVTRDLMGPLQPDEIETISDPPLTRYITAILYPQSNAVIDASQDIDVPEDENGGDETSVPDPPVAMANVRFPSSMGLTFAVDSFATDVLAVKIQAARYEKATDDDAPTSIIKRVRRGALGPTEPWRRIPLVIESVHIVVRKATPRETVGVADGLELFYRVRPADANGVVTVTLVLLNKHMAVPGARDAISFFQPKLIVRALNQPCAPFVERPVAEFVAQDEDLRIYRLLYRHAIGFSVGHGCSVEWEFSTESPGRAIEIRTSYVPKYDLQLSDSNPRIASVSMKQLAEGDRSESVAELQSLATGYRRWIHDRLREARSLPDDFRETAVKNIRECRTALLRIVRGIQVLATNDQAWNAFQLANSAMLEQRARTLWLKTGKRSPEPLTDSSHQWRPFQIAFILLCVTGMVESESRERSIADLLWFPTGGGKTEAYLGLIAFTTFLRRLRNPSIGGGVTVLMRYTLRLLTIQQFERAALLICCCESIRRRNPSLLGTDPIRIGLWVGRGATPNSLDEARAALNKFRQGTVPTEKNPVQLRSCPWCGEDLDHRNYYLADRDRRLVIACRNKDCEFSAELPVCVVDEDIYARRPTLIISTVDKFAALPWNEHTVALFNIGKPEPPPELIVQDELHLISGPLGTLTGLYETVIDAVCRAGDVGPKIVASTATIRRASSQVRGIFNREVRQFPSPGIDSRDSYFATEVDSTQKGTRLYVGAMAPGTSQTTLLVRTYAALLQFVADISGRPEVKDPYWTLLGYFNSLRVLAGAKLQVQDDVEDRVELLAREAGTSKRTIDEQIEMTSRESSADIPNHLKRMARRYPDRAALDVILATNMISVGVDIDRLGLMVVMGQPQSTSEYIQATSRVGRQFPGLVFTLFNAARSRDRSHYESFVTYHSALYRQVESTSVTPFSSRARDRGLHAVLIALARLTNNDFRPNDSAARVSNLAVRLNQAVELIVERVESVSREEAGATRRQLEAIISTWILAAEENPNLLFANYFHPDRALLVDAARDDMDMERKFATLQSLRDVDMSSNLYLVR
jgi:hypothetical protein